MNWRIQARDQQDSSDWHNVPMTWASTSDELIAAAMETVAGARRLVADSNRRVGWQRYRVVED